MGTGIKENIFKNLEFWMTRFFKRSLWDFHIISFLYCELNINMIYSVQTIKEGHGLLCVCVQS